MAGQRVAGVVVAMPGALAGGGGGRGGWARLWSSLCVLSWLGALEQRQ